MSNTTKLGQWLRAQAPYRREPLTHLKLQKLAFYCYGAALAFGCDDEVGEDITFEAWAHGPVCRSIWHDFRSYGGAPIPFLPENAAPTYAPTATQVMTDALAVYGAMTAWSLRQESHLEKPWRDAFGKSPAVIPREALRAHFRAKFTGPAVFMPEGLSGASSAQLDGIPPHGYKSLRELALAVADIARTRVSPRA